MQKNKITHFFTHSLSTLRLWFLGLMLPFFFSGCVSYTKINDLLNEKNYTLAKVKLEKIAEKKENEFLVLFLAAKFYGSEAENPYFAPDTAFTLLNRAESRLAETPKLPEWARSPHAREGLRQTLWGHFFSRATEAATDTAYGTFLAKYPTAPQAETAELRRDSLAFLRLRNERHIEKFEFFLQKYPRAKQAARVVFLRDSLQFRQAILGGNAQALRNFLREHPKSDFAEAAALQLLGRESVRHKPESYLSFFREFPETEAGRRAAWWYFSLTKEALTPVLVHWKSRLAQAPFYPQKEAKKLTLWSSKLEKIQISLDTLQALFSSARRYSTSLVMKASSEKVGRLRVDGKWAVPPRFDAVLETQNKQLFRVREKEFFGLWHIGNFEVLPAHYSDVQAVGMLGLWATRRGRRWEFFRENGSPASLPACQNWELLGEHFLCWRTDSLFVFSNNELEKKTTFSARNLTRAGIFLQRKVGRNGFQWYRLSGEKLTQGAARRVAFLEAGESLWQDQKGFFVLKKDDFIRLPRGRYTPLGKWLKCQNGAEVSLYDTKGKSRFPAGNWRFQELKGGLAVLGLRDTLLIDEYGKSIPWKANFLPRQILHTSGKRRFVRVFSEDSLVLLNDSLQAIGKIKKYKEIKALKNDFYLLTDSLGALLYSPKSKTFPLLSASVFLPLDSLHLAFWEAGRFKVFSLHLGKALPFSSQRIPLRVGSFWLVQTEGRISIFSTEGKSLFPHSWEEAKALGKRFLLLRKGQNWRIWQVREKQFLPEKFSVLNYFGDLAFLKGRNGWGCLSAEKWLLPPRFQAIEKLHGERVLRVVQPDGNFYFFQY